MPRNLYVAAITWRASYSTTPIARENRLSRQSCSKPADPTYT